MQSRSWVTGMPGKRLLPTRYSWAAVSTFGNYQGGIKNPFSKRDAIRASKNPTVAAIVVILIIAAVMVT
jgi:hypothetical protein